MTQGETTAQALHAALDDYLRVYFGERDLDKTLAMISPQCVGAGTGGDELVLDPDALTSLYTRDIGEVPTPIGVEELHRRVTVLSAESGLTFSVLNLHIEVMDNAVNLNALRLSTAWAWHAEAQRWLVYHMHVSLPSDAHEPDESFPIKELEARNAVLERLVAKRTAELMAAKEAAEQRASYDQLTGLPTRESFQQHVQGLAESAIPAGQVLAVMVVDLDGFKPINDSYGHKVGDVILQAVADRLAERAGNVGVVARMGGDEFVAALTVAGSDCAAAARLAATELYDGLVAPYRLDMPDVPAQLQLGAAIGVAVLTDPEADIWQVVDAADRAMYTAKGSGDPAVAVAGLADAATAAGGASGSASA